MKPSPCRRGLPTPDVVNQLAQSSALGEVLASGLRALNNNPQCSEADLRATMEGAAAPWPTGWKST
jgi:biopolymer transport protein ExbB